eukprot:269089_1
MMTHSQKGFTVNKLKNASPRNFNVSRLSPRNINISPHLINKLSPKTQTYLNVDHPTHTNMLWSSSDYKTSDYISSILTGNYEEEEEDEEEDGIGTIEVDGIL